MPRTRAAIDEKIDDWKDIAGVLAFFSRNTLGMGGGAFPRTSGDDCGPP